MDIRVSNSVIDTTPKSIDPNQTRSDTSASSSVQPLQQIAVQPTSSAVSTGQLKQAVQSINDTMRALSQNVEFSVDADDHRTIVRVVDQQTKEVIRQMPSAEALEIAKALDRVQGLLIHQKA